MVSEGTGVDLLALLLYPCKSLLRSASLLFLQNLEQRHSPAQEALMRVQGRIAEIGFEPGAAVVSRLLVHARHMSCLFGNGGILIAELRRVTGASIRIFPREQSPKYGSHTEEVLQVDTDFP